MIRVGCQSGKNMVPHDSKSDLPLARSISSFSVMVRFFPHEISQRNFFSSKSGYVHWNSFNNDYQAQSIHFFRGWNRALVDFAGGISCRETSRSIGQRYQALQNELWYRYCTSNTLGYTWILTCRYWWQSLQVPLQRRGSYMTFTGWWVMQSCRPATGASSGAARVISNVSQHNGGLENNFGGTETFLTNHFMVINSKCFCGDRLTSVCLDISDVRVCASAANRSIGSTTGCTITEKALIGAFSVIVQLHR